MKNKVFPVVVGIVVGILMGVLIANVSPPVLSGDSVGEQVHKFRTILDNASKNYVDEVYPGKLTETAVKAMLAELDPHSIYIPAEQKLREDEDFRGNFEGIGVYFEILHDTATVISPITGGPSEKLGILAGDKIVKINGDNAVKLTDTQIIKRLKGTKGTKVTIGIKRAAEKNLLDFTIVRDKIPIYSVEASFLFEGTDVGIVAINRFAATTVNEFLAAARDLKKRGMKKLILDLRRNPGGYLEQAYELADAFIPAGQKIVYTRGRRSDFNDEYFSTGGGEFEQIPLIVLIDEGSASASEIVAGAIQDLDRGLIVGETSFGKGLVQRPYDLNDGSSYRLTISRYYTPSGRSIQRPYKNAVEYKRLAGRVEANEGENINHSGEKIASDSTRPIFKTANGRKVYGGGGIVPDYVVKHDTVTKLYRELVTKVLRDYCDAFLSQNGDKLRTNYKTSFAKFYSGYEISKSELAKIVTFARSKGVQVDDEQFAADEKYIQMYVKSAIARFIWNLNEANIIEAMVDKQILKAIELFPEAKKIARMN